MATTISTQDIVNAKRDIEDIGKAVNEEVIVSPRYGEDFKSLPMIAAEFQDAINTIVIDDGVPALAVSDASGKTQQQINDSTKNKIASIKDYGAKYNGTSDLPSLTSAQDAHKEIIIDDGDTFIPIFVNLGKIIRGNGKPVITVDPNAVGSNPVCVQFRAGSTTENVTFQSTAENKEWQRAEIKSNSILRNVGLYGFRHPTAAPNAWGLYLANCSNVLIDTCHFGDNSQADIALVDNVKNVTVIQPRNDGGVIFNIEPNGNDVVENVNVIGGWFKRFYCLQNSVTGNPIKAVSVTGATIDEFIYRGGQISLTSTVIKALGHIGDYCYLGQLKIDNAMLSANLIKDPYFSDISLGGNSWWTYYSPDAKEVYRRTHSDIHGSYTTLNPDLDSFTNIRTPFIDVTAGEFLALQVCRRLNNAANAIDWEVASLRFYDSSDTFLSERKVAANTGAFGSTLGFLNEVGLFQIPVGCSKLRIYFTNKLTACSYDMRYVGLYRINLITSSGNFNSVIERGGSPALTKTYYRDALPTGTRLSTYQANDRIIINASADNAITEYVVQTSGAWGVVPVFKPVSKVSKFISVTAPISETVLSSNTWSSENTVSMSGVVRGDAVVGSYVGDFKGCVLSVYVSDTNFIKYKIHNPTGASVTLPASNIVFKTV